MITPKFYLKDKKSEKETLISMKFKIDNKSFQYSTKKCILPELWDFDTQRPVPYKKVPSIYKKRISNLKILLINITNELNLLSEICQSEFADLKRNNEYVDLKQLKERIKQRTKVQDGKEEDSSLETVEQYLKRFISEIETDERIINLGKNRGQKYRKSVLQAFKFWESGIWTPFIDKNKKYKNLNWEEVDDNLYNDFVRFLISKNYSNNTIGKHVKNLNTIISNAYNEGVSPIKKSFKVFQNEVTKFVLDENEINLLLNHKFDNPIQVDVDLFLIGCYTALRFSDLTRLKKDNFIYKDNSLFLNIHSLKETINAKIPISPKILPILEKYDFNAPKTNNPKMNKNIKIACEIVGIKNVVEVVIDKGGKKIIETFKKYELIHAHTARRTAATNLYKGGTEPITIMKITGHKKLQSLMKYIVLDDDDVAEVITTNPYFK